jgi:hypothetical protein
MMASSSAIKREIKDNPDEFADLYRDIRGQFTKGRPRRVVLRHIRPHGGDADVQNWPGEYFEGLPPDQFTEEVVAAIHDDAKIFQGVQRYGLFFFRKNEVTHDARVLLTIPGGATGEDLGDTYGAGGSEGGESGRQMQIMRHDEAFARLAIQATQHALQSKDQTIARQEAIIEKLMSSFVPMVTAVQNLLDKTAERDLRVERTRKMYDLMDKGGEMLMGFAPLVLADKVEEKNPKLAQMIRQAASNPAGDIFKILVSELEANPQQGMLVFEAVKGLPNGAAIIQALSQLQAMTKQQNGTVNQTGH